MLLQLLLEGKSLSQIIDTALATNNKPLFQSATRLLRIADIAKGRPIPATMALR